MTKTDWELIEEEYIYGYINDEGQKIFPSINQLSTRHDIPRGTIGNHATKGNWAQKKEDKKDKIRQKVDEHKTEFEAQNIIQSDDKFEDLGQLIRRVSKKKLEQLEKDLDNPDPKVFVRSIDIVNAANAGRTGQEIVKTAQGEILNRSAIDQNTNLKVDLTDPDFQKKELEFMNKLIKK